MSREWAELHWLEEDTRCTLVELAARSRFSEGELLELVATGVIPPLLGGAAAGSFSGHALDKVRIAARLRNDFELDIRGVALALALLERIGALERELRQLRVCPPPHDPAD
jgi:chaperone modulatory protein CbpM